jgi:hypothetical protein
MNLGWMAVLLVLTFIALAICGILLWKRTRFS